MTWKKRPEVLVEVQGVQLTALLDTGATRTIVAEEMMNEISGMKFANKPSTVKVAKDPEVRIPRTAQVQIKVGPWTLRTEALIREGTTARSVDRLGRIEAVTSHNRR
eukprot:Plantae.Rhodophyta-Purpureofilum_apyrenoidigerum.ctg43937.p1 GENE.Plantae.Rhodophyta-Purpureofilum_apyrenoidigerum.ctg43937~~Plantae.Rhodophyta-Purpureofilum_apyrenoidigerum.ctg43937.p1  ORF type:complete len:107 (+),score=9.52 Plantae.Rhodophyta-Purpureofilum_apyrenoidigerum.ctg43937:351-671(+)